MDRILRFPVTGDRQRNYDDLGGQILFAALHHDESVRWEDAKLSIDWTAVDGSVQRLDMELRSLYRLGQILPKPHY